MIAAVLGRLFQAFGRLRGGDDGAALAAVGGELVRLARAPPYPPASSR
jgi:hypothetical protein